MDAPSSSQIGETFTIQFKLDFPGWTEIRDGEPREYDGANIYGTFANVRVDEFYSQRPHPVRGTQRGFRGQITAPGHLFDGMFVIAATIDGMPTDGVIDFAVTPDPNWRYWLSQTELPLPTHSNRQMMVTDLIAGIGVLLEKPVSPEA